VTLLKRLGGVVGLAALAAALSLLVSSPVAAADVSIQCSGSFFSGTEIPDTDGNVTLVGPGWCVLANGSTVNGNVEVTGTAQLELRGTVNGDVIANTNLPISSPGLVSRNLAAVFVHRFGVKSDIKAVVNGDVKQEGTGEIFVGGDSLVSGDVIQEGPGALFVGAGLGKSTTVKGHVINEGPGGVTLVRTFDRATATIEGDVKAEGGGGGDIGAVVNPGLSPLLGGPITIGGDTCGVTIGLLVTVNGEIETDC